MRNVAPHEIITLNRLLQMEVNSLALSKAAKNVITDEKFKSLTDAGITAMENRIVDMQNFINENIKPHQQNCMVGEGVQ